MLPLGRRHHLCLHWSTAGGHLIDHRNCHLAIQRERESPRYRRGSHGQEMRPACAFASQQLPLARAEAMLLIDDCEPEVRKLDSLFDQRVRPDDKSAVPGRCGGSHPAPLRRALAADEELDGKTWKAVLQVGAKLVEMLAGQDL